MRNPWIKFYPTDWRGEACLRVCSLGARGLWMEMLTVMHESVPRGSLTMNGKPMTIRQLSALVGAPGDEVENLLCELRDAGVFSEDEDGTIFSRRMRRDEKKEIQDKANGQLGGNPYLRQGTVAKEERVRRFRRSDAPTKAQRIFDRSDGCCHWCQEKLDPQDYNISHIKAVRDGGTNDESNLVASCPDCNRRREIISNKFDSDHNPQSFSDHKAQKLEARVQKPEYNSQHSSSTTCEPWPPPNQKFDFEEIERRCRHSAGLTHSPEPNLFVIGPIVELISEGFDLERDICPVLRAKAAKKQFGRSWKFYIEAIRDARVKTSGKAPEYILPDPKKEPCFDMGGGFRAVPERNLIKQLDRFFETGLWPFPSPKPGELNCLVPNQYLAQHLRQSPMQIAAE